MNKAATVAKFSKGAKIVDATVEVRPTHTPGVLACESSPVWPIITHAPAAGHPRRRYPEGHHSIPQCRQHAQCISKDADIACASRGTPSEQRFEWLERGRHTCNRRDVADTHGIVQGFPVSLRISAAISGQMTFDP